MQTELIQPTTSGMEPDPGTTLLAIARAAIAQAVGLPQAAVDESVESLQQFGACFITLNQQGKLRGCIGSLEARRPLLVDIKANAVAAALHDTRFEPLTAAELAYTDIEVSLLSPMQALQFDTEAQALAQLRPGIDGVVLQYRRYSSTFLPQVWAQLPTVTEFMAHLKYKAGLPPDFWGEGMQLHRYTVQKWKEIEVT